MTRTTDFRVILALLTCGVTGGSSFIFIKLLVGQITPLQLAAARVSMAAPLLLAVVLVRRSMPRLSRPLLLGAAILGLVDTATPFLLIAWASQHVTSSTAALLVSTVPLFTTLIASQTLPDERLSISLFLGLVFGALGVFILTGQEALDIRNSSTLAAFAVLLSAACYATGVVYSRFLLRRSDPISLSALKLSFAAMILVPVAVTVDGLAAFGSLSAIGLVGLIEVGFISTGLGRCLLQWVIAKAGSVRASLVTYIIPVVTLVLSWTILGEPIALNTLTGAALVMGGVALAMYGSQLFVFVLLASKARRAAAS